MPYEDASFDAVVMNFGVLHLSRPEHAFAEAHRVLRAGGRFAFTVWAPPGEARGFALMLAAIEQAGDLNVPLPPGPPFFRFSEASECEAALSQAGFAQIEVTTLPLEWRLPSAEALYDAFHQGTARSGGLLRAQTSEASAAIRVRVRELARAYERDGTLVIPMPAVLVRGERQ